MVYRSYQHNKKWCQSMKGQVKRKVEDLQTQMQQDPSINPLSIKQGDGINIKILFEIFPTHFGRVHLLSNIVFLSIFHRRFSCLNCIYYATAHSLGITSRIGTVYDAKQVSTSKKSYTTRAYYLCLLIHIFFVYDTNYRGLFFIIFSFEDFKVMSIMMDACFLAFEVYFLSFIK